MLAGRVSSHSVRLLTLCLLFVQTYANREITYTPITNFSGRILYQRNVESEDLCLNICYDCLYCKFVSFSEDICTLYQMGSNTYSLNEVTYELKHTADLDYNPTCAREVPLRPTVRFEPIDVQNTESITCSGAPSDVTTIYMYFTDRDFTLFANTKLEDFKVAKRLDFARTSQPHCDSVPVFTGPSSSRLYFGTAFNVSGYHFLNAYAFAGKCTCNGACCGDIAIDEYYWKGHGYAYVNSLHSIMRYCNLLNEQQQFFIVDAQWLV
ncbi:unnamed protein product [Cylicocyclus nassatus]|uniref:PAN-3 domain-containing protein n=1 Tax=Cylicocyclus nassatus TaxID=53992 RepID=A0AA36HC09_CYLNA|nr:unnamed protein product [Cylicocyclus nassatus]